MNRGVTSGRTIAARNNVRSAYCQGCDMRLLVGEPKASSAWPALLMLTSQQVDVLLMAAAEWEELGGGTAGPHRASHRHPFPLPLGGRGVR